jgi:hypothetical protein
MAEFNSATDIGNRGLQHVGASLMGSLGFAEQTKQARQVSFCYGKLRRAQLRENVWKFATRRAAIRPISASTMFLVPALWTQSTTYFRGSIVSDENGVPWRSKIPDNTGNQPENSPNTWEPYFGPLTVSLWDTTGTTAYFAGELVYTTAGDGTNRVYASLINANSDNPATATAWSATTTYYKDQVVTENSIAYMSRIDNNLNQDPATTFFAEWASTTTYASGTKVTGSDGTIYTSKVNGNVNHDPTLDVTATFWTNTGILSPWDTTFVGGTGSVNWLQIGGKEFPNGVTVTTLDTSWPIGVGPVSQTVTRNAYRLPAGFIRIAPDDPKNLTGVGAWAPVGHAAKDWLFEGPYLVSWDSNPIVLRFVADVVDVTSMDDLFCEALAAKIGQEVCEPLTQETTKITVCTRAYNDAVFKAKAQNAIEIGYEDPPEDDLILCRY